MKLRMLLPTVACVLCLLSVVFAQRGEDRAGEIQSAGAVILSRSASMEDIHRSMVRLVETLSRIAEEQEICADCRKKTASALIRVRENPLGHEARQALDEVYKSLHGRTFVFPSGIGSIESATTYARMRIEASAKAARENHPRQAALELLDFLLTVATPMEQTYRSNGPLRVVIPLWL